MSAIANRIPTGLAVLAIALAILIDAAPNYAEAAADPVASASATSVASESPDPVRVAVLAWAADTRRAEAAGDPDNDDPECFTDAAAEQGIYGVSRAEWLTYWSTAPESALVAPESAPQGYVQCVNEDDLGPCYWDAATQGNGVGRSFYVTDVQQIITAEG